MPTESVSKDIHPTPSALVGELVLLTERYGGATVLTAFMNAGWTCADRMDDCDAASAASYRQAAAGLRVVIAHVENAEMNADRIRLADGLDVDADRLADEEHQKDAKR